MKHRKSEKFAALLVAILLLFGCAAFLVSYMQKERAWASEVAYPAAKTTISAASALAISATSELPGAIPCAASSSNRFAPLTAPRGFFVLKWI